jgi:3-methyladenine DNA glycosylase AlkC
MAEPLKNQYGPEIPRTIARMLSAVYPKFRQKAFLAEVSRGYDDLELLDRGRRIATVLHAYLPNEYPRALEILVESSRVPVKRNDQSMASFLYFPHLHFVGSYGLDHFEESMAAQHELTQKFTAEFSIRPFLERYPEVTLERLEAWTSDPSPDVRRLVSEGTRPRLPWAPRLRRFLENPAPVLSLLDRLKDDPELYVRRSVANNLNDIGKDHPDVLVETAKGWIKGASETRRWIVRHALRSLVKKGDPGALAVLGFGSVPKVSVKRANLSPSKVSPGGSVTLSFDLTSTATRRQRLLVDFCVYFVKANGSTAPKVFKLKTFDLAPNETVSLRKSISLKPMTTRRHYPGKHRVEVLLNGREFEVGSFAVVSE